MAEQSEREPLLLHPTPSPPQHTTTANTKAAVAHLLLATGLLAAAAFRVSATSLAYLLLLLFWLRLPVAHRAARTLLYATLAAAALACLGHMAFQIAMAAVTPYGRNLPWGSRTAIAFQELGFGRMDGRPWPEDLRFLLPDFGLLLLTLLLRPWIIGAVRLAAISAVVDATYDRRRQSYPQPHTELPSPPSSVSEDGARPHPPLGAPSPATSRRSLRGGRATPQPPEAVAEAAFWRQARRWWRGPWPLAMSLLVCSSCLPSIFGSVYLLAYFILIMTWTFQGPIRKVTWYVRFFMVLAAGLHLVLMYIYQFRSVHRNWTRHAALVGLYDYVVENPHSSEPLAQHAADMSWPYAVLLLFLGLLYIVANTDSRAARPVRRVVGAGSSSSRGRSPGRAMLAPELVIGGAAASQLSRFQQLLSKYAHRALQLAIVGGIMAWALAFPSWFGLLYLLWATLGLCLPSARKFLLPSLPLLVIVSCAIFAFDYLTAMPDVDFADTPTWHDWGVKPKDLRKLALQLGAKLLLIALFALGSYFRNRSRQSCFSINASGADTQAADEEVFAAPTSSLERVGQTLWLVAATVVEFLLRYLVWVTATVVYVAALEDVTIVNALYLVLIISFMSLPRFRERYWVALVLYSQAVIALLYIWGFSFSRRGGQYEDLIGLDRDSHKHIWQTMKWQLGILVLAVAQLMLYRWSRSANTVTALRRQGSSFIEPLIRQGSFDAEEQRPENGSGGSQGPATLRVILALISWWEAVVHYAWPLVACMTLFCAGFLGSVTLLRLGFVVLLALRLILFEMKQMAALRSLNYVTLLYAASVLVLEYTYQFGGVRHHLNKWLSDDIRSDLGLRDLDTQFRLFVYLLPTSLVLVSTVIQLRLLANQPPQPKAFLKAPRWLTVAGITVLRFLSLHVMKTIVYLLFADVIHPRPQLLDFPSIIFLALALGAQQRSIGLPLLIWVQSLLVVKLLYQTRTADRLRPVSPLTAEWCGFSKLEHGEQPAELVQWEIYIVLAVVIHRLLKYLRPVLWPGVPPGKACYLFDETCFEPADDGARTYTGAPASSPAPAAALKLSAHTSTRDILAFHINHFLRIHGVELCNLLALIVPLVRLNAIAVVYFIFFLMLGTRRRKPSPFVWRIFITIQTAFLFYQYASAMGLPPTIPYPWQHASYGVTAFLRWLYLPIAHIGESNTIPRAPLAWNGTPVLYADFSLLVASSLLLRGLGPQPPEFQQRYQLLNARSTEQVSMLRRVTFLALPWLCWFMTLVTILSRADILCFGYLGLTAYVFWNYISCLADPEGSKAHHRRLLRYAAAMVMIHLVWILPAVVFNWGKLRNLDDLWQVLGVRWGQDLQLHPEDPRVSVWSPGSGLLFDALLLILLTVHCKLIYENDDKAIHLAFLQYCKAATQRAELFYLDLAQQAERAREQRDREFRETEELIENIHERAAVLKGEKLSTDPDIPQFFSRQKMTAAQPAPVDSNLPDAPSLEHGGPRETEAVATPPAARQSPQPLEPSPTPPTIAEPAPPEPPTASSGGLFSRLALRMATALRNANARFAKLFLDNAVYHDHKLQPNLGDELLRFFWVRTHWLAYFLVVINALVRPSFLTFLSLLAIFLWASLSRPAPSFRFWTALYYYTLATLALQYLFQFSFWGSFNDPAPSNDPCRGSFMRSGCLTFARFFGIYRVHDGPHFQTELLSNVVLLFGLGLHRLALETLGLWSADKSVLWAEASQPVLPILRDESNGARADSANSTNLASKDETEDGGETSDEDEDADDTSQADFGPSSTPLTRILEHFKNFYRNLVSPHGRVERDYYIPTFLVEFTAFIVICFGWSGFRPETQYQTSAAAAISSNNIPSGQLLYMLLQFVLIVAERAIYLRRAITAKIVFYIFNVCLIHILVFYWIPLSTRRAVQDNSVILVLYLLKVAYFLLSSAQICAGYPMTVQRNALTRYATTFGITVFTIYKLIPFLYELRMLLDWSCLATTLYLGQWFQMEDISGQLYMNQYNIGSVAADKRTLGQRQPLWRKLLVGALLVVLLIVVLWFPLLAISFVNQGAVSNLPQRVSLTLTLNSYQPLFIMDTLAPEPSIAPSDYDQLKDLDDSGLAATYRSSDVQRVLLSPLSKQLWDISPSSRQSLVETLQNVNSTVALTLTWAFDRSERAGIAATPSGSLAYQPQNPAVFREELLTALSDPTGTVHLPLLLPTFYKLGSSESIETLDKLPAVLGRYRADCTLVRYTQSQGNGTSVEWWGLNQTSPHVLTTTDDGGGARQSWLEMVSFNDRVIPESWSFISSYGIVGLYVSVVLVIGRFLRMSVDMASRSIIFQQMPQVKTLRNLCTAIYVAREHNKLDLEEELFALLVQLYRSPEALILWTDKRLLLSPDLADYDAPVH